MDGLQDGDTDALRILINYLKHLEALDMVTVKAEAGSAEAVIEVEDGDRGRRLASVLDGDLRMRCVDVQRDLDDDI